MWASSKNNNYRSLFFIFVTSSKWWIRSEQFAESVIKSFLYGFILYELSYDFEKRWCTDIMVQRHWIQLPQIKIWKRFKALKCYELVTRSYYFVQWLTDWLTENDNDSFILEMYLLSLVFFHLDRAKCDRVENFLRAGIWGRGHPSKCCMDCLGAPQSHRFRLASMGVPFKSSSLRWSTEVRSHFSNCHVIITYACFQLIDIVLLKQHVPFLKNFEK